MKYPCAELKSSRLNCITLCTVATVLLGVIVLTGCESDSGSSGSEFEVLPLDAPMDAYRSKMWTTRSATSIETIPAGLRCVIQGEQTADKAPYGGIMLPATDAKRWRLELGFPDADAIQRVFVDSYNSEEKRVSRWQTGFGKKLSREKTLYEFVPGQPAQLFEPVASEGAGPIEKIHVFVSVKPGGRAAFELYSAEIAR